MLQPPIYGRTPPICYPHRPVLYPRSKQFRCKGGLVSAARLWPACCLLYPAFQRIRERASGLCGPRSVVALLCEPRDGPHWRILDDERGSEVRDRGRAELSRSRTPDTRKVVSHPKITKGIMRSIGLVIFVSSWIMMRISIAHTR